MTIRCILFIYAYLGLLLIAFFHYKKLVVQVQFNKCCIKKPSAFSVQNILKAVNCLKLYPRILSASDNGFHGFLA